MMNPQPIFYSGRCRKKGLINQQQFSVARGSNHAYTTNRKTKVKYSCGLITYWELLIDQLSFFTKMNITARNLIRFRLPYQYHVHRLTAGEEPFFFLFLRAITFCISSHPTSESIYACLLDTSVIHSRDHWPFQLMTQKLACKFIKVMTIPHFFWTHNPRRGMKHIKLVSQEMNYFFTSILMHYLWLPQYETEM